MEERFKLRKGTYSLQEDGLSEFAGTSDFWNSPITKLGHGDEESSLLTSLTKAIINAGLIFPFIHKHCLQYISISYDHKNSNVSD